MKAAGDPDPFDGIAMQLPDLLTIELVQVLDQCAGNADKASQSKGLLRISTDAAP